MRPHQGGRNRGRQVCRSRPSRLPGTPQSPDEGNAGRPLCHPGGNMQPGLSQHSSTTKLGLTEIRIAGFGGQGVILAAVVIGKAAAIFKGAYATMTQSFGPEARGGSSAAQVILSGEPILYPYVTQPDILMVMSQEAYKVFKPQLKPGGILIVEQDLVRIDHPPQGVRFYGCPATCLAEEHGRKVVLTIVMVGFFAAVTHMLDPDSLRQ